MTTTADLDSRAGVLAGVRAARRAELVATADQLRFAAGWASMHSVDSLDEAAASAVFAETVVPIAGPGAPLVGEFCVAQFSAAMGLPTEVGRELLGEAVELEHRLPRVWRRVMRHELPAWRARRIARQTMALSEVAAEFVDRQVAGVAHTIGPTATERLIDAAIAQLMPETAEELRRQAADGRHFTVDHRQLSFTGTSRVYGELDLADALDLDAAVTARAAVLKELGSPDSLDARRAAAVGEIARADLTLDLTLDLTTADPSRVRRKTVLYLHLHRDALTGDSVVGRVENTGGGTGTLVTADQIRDWCGNPFAHVVVKPVIDLEEHVHVGSYEVPDRLAEQVKLRDAWCVFPWCTRPARSSDCDHIVPHAEGGATCDCNLAPLCRRHHRLKTHAPGWRYTGIDPGTYLWSSPYGYQLLRDHTGTRDATHDPPPRPG